MHLPVQSMAYAFLSCRVPVISHSLHKMQEENTHSCLDVHMFNSTTDEWFLKTFLNRRHHKSVPSHFVQSVAALWQAHRFAEVGVTQLQPPTWGNHGNYINYSNNRYGNVITEPLPRERGFVRSKTTYIFGNGVSSSKRRGLSFVFR
jgi:hypothetical protein